MSKKKKTRAYTKSDKWYATHGKSMQKAAPMKSGKSMSGAKEHFEILDHIPESSRRARMTPVEAKKYDNTIRLLTPNKRSTVLDKSSKNKMINYCKKFYPDYKIRSSKKDVHGKSFIVWREA